MYYAKKPVAMVKKKLLVSFSGGETSAYMALLIWVHWREDYETAFVFANTGQENEATLEFIRDFEKHYGIRIYWIEGVFNPEFGKGTKSKLINFTTASRDGEPFEAYVSIYGLPNISNPQCTRELKGAPIKAFAREVLGWRKYFTAIGIRSDEADRISKDKRNARFLYPLISTWPTTKPDVNAFWASQPFRLRLKGYQGNCKWCWKKSKPKLLKIAQEDPSVFAFPLHLEKTYGNFFPEQRRAKWLKEGKTIPQNIKMFRGHLGADDLLAEAFLSDPIEILDDAVRINPALGQPVDPQDLDLIGGESCEVWAECQSEDDEI